MVLGVTGHRYLVREEELRAVVREVLRDLRRRLPHTPFLLLSPLAEGADQLVAEVALQLDIGAELVAVLPFAEEEYVGTMGQGAGARLHQLLDQAREKIRVPEEGSRETRFALAGSFVARHCHLLIALWDGEAEAGTGGTAQVVHLKRRGRLPADRGLQEVLARAPEPFGIKASPLDPLEPGWVVQVQTRRMGSAAPDEPPTVHWLVPETETGLEPTARASSQAAAESLGLPLLEECNRDSIVHERRLAKVRRGREPLLGRPREGLSDETVVGLRRQFETADGLAAYFQAKTRQAMAILGLVVVAALVPLLIYTNLAAEPFPDEVWVLALYLFVLALADLHFSLADYREKQRKYLDYRALAEGLRVQLFWTLAGVERSAADDYLRWQRSELGWIRQAVRTSSAFTLPRPREPMADLVLEDWIRHQAAYFAASAPQKELRLIEKDLTGRLLLGLSFALALVEIARAPGWLWLDVALAATGLYVVGRYVYQLRLRMAQADEVAEGLPESLHRGVAVAAFCAALGGLALAVANRALGSWIELESGATGWLVTAMGLAATGGGIAFAHLHTLALSDEARQADRMRRVFQRGAEALRGLHGDPAAREACLLDLPSVVEELGREALSENADWLLLHRRRPVERPYI